MPKVKFALRFSSIAIFLVLAAFPHVVATAEMNAAPRLWSSKGAQIGTRSNKMIAAPDTSRYLEAQNGKLILKPGGQEIQDLIRPVEVLWSPDSSAFSITESLGGEGPVYAYLRFLGQEVPEGLQDLNERLVENFATRHPEQPCGKWANSGVFAWLQNGTQLALAIEVPPTFRCGRTAGYFDVYIVAVPTGQIVQILDMDSAALKLGEYFGGRLKDDLATVREMRKDVEHKQQNHRQR